MSLTPRAVRGAKVPAPSRWPEWFLTFLGPDLKKTVAPLRMGTETEHSLKALRNFQETKDVNHTLNCKIKNAIHKTSDLGRLDDKSGP